MYCRYAKTSIWDHEKYPSNGGIGGGTNGAQAPQNCRGVSHFINKNKIMMNIKYFHVCNAERSRGTSASVNSNTSELVFSEQYYVVCS